MSTSSTTSFFSRQTCEIKTVPYTETVQTKELQRYKEQQCRTEQLDYRVYDWWIDSRHPQQEYYYDYHNLKCTPLRHLFNLCNSPTYYPKQDRKITCNIDLQNLDYREGGKFSVKFIFYNKYNEQYTTRAVTRHIAPGEIEHFYAAETAYSCDYKITRIPKKQLCYYTAQYKEVPVTRQIIKYKTTEVCN